MKSIKKIILGILGSFSLLTLVQANAQIIISEVMSSENGSQTYNQDWFELTNTGTTAVDITGWKMDDNSDAFGSAVALRLTGNTIAAGQSVVFVESTGSSDATVQAAFESSWFGTNVPSGFAIGGYNGSGVGLSSTADEVNIFNASGTKIAGVGFGTATKGVSFDNSVGLNSTGSTDVIISTLSVAGSNGAFIAPSGEVGSPGAVPEPSTYALMLGGFVMLIGFQFLRRNNIA